MFPLYCVRRRAATVQGWSKGYLRPDENGYEVEHELADVIQVEAALAFVGQPIAAQAGRDVGLEIEFRGMTMMESADPPLHLVLNLDSFLKAMGPPATWLRDKVADKAEEMAIETALTVATLKTMTLLKRVPALVRRFSELATTRKTIVTVKATDESGARRLYPVDMTDMDAATVAILRDLGVPLEEPNRDRHRAWYDGRWIAMSDYWAEVEAKKRGGPQA